MNSTAQHSTAQHSTIFKKYWLSFIASSVLVLASCGGGGGSSSSQAPTSVITGTAAVGSPVVGGTANIKCASNTGLPTSTTSAVGGLSITLTGQTYPCAIQITGGTIDGVTNTTSYHSIALSAGNVNATPLTDLLIANLAGTTTPSTWFTNLTTAQLAAITAPRVATALTNLQNALGTTLPTSIHPITTAFNPVAGVQMDDVLSAFAIALTNHGTSHISLLASAGSSIGAAFTTPVGFTAAFATGFTKTLTGGGVPAATSYSPTIIALNGTLTVTGTNLLPVTTVSFIGPAIGGVNGISPFSSNTQYDGIILSHTATSITVGLPSTMIPAMYKLSIKHPGGGEANSNDYLIYSASGTGAPKTINISSPNTTQRNIQWPVTDGALGYNLYRSTSQNVTINSANKIFTTNDGNIVSFTDTGLTSNTAYYYALTTLYSFGESGAYSPAGRVSADYFNISRTYTSDRQDRDFYIASAAKQNLTVGSFCEARFTWQHADNTAHELKVTFRQSDQAVTGVVFGTSSVSPLWQVSVMPPNNLSSYVLVSTTNKEIYFNYKIVTGTGTAAATLHGTLPLPPNGTTAACGV